MSRGLTADMLERIRKYQGYDLEKQIMDTVLNRLGVTDAKKPFVPDVTIPGVTDALLTPVIPDSDQRMNYVLSNWSGRVLDSTTGRKKNKSSKRAYPQFVVEEFIDPGRPFAVPGFRLTYAGVNMYPSSDYAPSYQEVFVDTAVRQCVEIWGDYLRECGYLGDGCGVFWLDGYDNVFKKTTHCSTAHIYGHLVSPKVTPDMITYGRSMAKRLV